jgi:putative transposase
MFVSVPPNVAISALMQRVKGRSSYKIQRISGYPQTLLGPVFLGQGARGNFSTTSGNITDDIILQYINQHTDKPTDPSR